MSTSLGRIAPGTSWMAKLLVEEPDALMHARPDLWEPWVVTPRATRPARTKKLSFGAEVDSTYRSLGKPKSRSN